MPIPCPIALAAAGPAAQAKGSGACVAISTPLLLSRGVLRTFKLACRRAEASFCWASESPATGPLPSTFSRGRELCVLSLLLADEDLAMKRGAMFFFSLRTSLQSWKQNEVAASSGRCRGATAPHPRSSSHRCLQGLPYIWRSFQLLLFFLFFMTISIMYCYITRRRG